nr:MAG TPA: hypothetical protein [Bacteriophage sp.]
MHLLFLNMLAFLEQYAIVLLLMRYLHSVL